MRFSENKLKTIYFLLYSKYGPQGWWPLTAKGESAPEYFGKKPSTEQQVFEVIAGAVLTQNTSWKNVEKAIIKLNKSNILSIKGILNSSQKKMAKIIRSSGYYNQKAIKLKTIAKFLSSNKISQLRKKSTKELRKLLLNIKGIGLETADSILLYAFEKPVFVVDAYTKRIFSNLGFIKMDYDYEKIRNLFESNLPKDYMMYKEYHALIVEHAKRACTKKPKCEGCVIKNLCMANKVFSMQNGC